MELCGKAHVLQSLIDKVNADHGRNDLNKAWFVEHQQIKKAFAPDLWQALVKALTSGAESITAATPQRIIAEPGHQILSLKNATTGAWINLQFDPHTPRINFQTAGPNGYLVFKVNDDGNGVKFVDPKREAVMFPDELADVLLKHLL